MNQFGCQQPVMLRREQAFQEISVRVPFLEVAVVPLFASLCLPVLFLRIVMSGWVHRKPVNPSSGLRLQCEKGGWLTLKPCGDSC